jgi:hypothetical protein
MKINPLPTIKQRLKLALALEALLASALFGAPSVRISLRKDRRRVTSQFSTFRVES